MSVRAGVPEAGARPMEAAMTDEQPTPDAIMQLTRVYREL